MPTKVAQPSHSVETSVQTRLYLPHERARRWAAGKCEASDSGTEPKKPAHAREATDHVRRSECVCCACGTDQTLGINFVREDHPLRDALQVNRRRLSMNTENTLTVPTPNCSCGLTTGEAKVDSHLRRKGEQRRKVRNAQIVGDDAPAAVRRHVDEPNFARLRWRMAAAVRTTLWDRRLLCCRGQMVANRKVRCSNKWWRSAAFRVPREAAGTLGWHASECAQSGAPQPQTPWATARIDSTARDNVRTICSPTTDLMRWLLHDCVRWCTRLH